jgi:hypothetical protein
MNWILDPFFIDCCEIKSYFFQTIFQIVAELKNVTTEFFCQNKQECYAIEEWLS